MIKITEVQQEKECNHGVDNDMIVVLKQLYVKPAIKHLSLPPDSKDCSDMASFQWPEFPPCTPPDGWLPNICGWPMWID